ncbi:MAG: aspartate aminotransferase family protein [Bryobacteraceae bacterium]|nr:aspartate aminotransferase family protein [Bryobacteraceae bacterium]
MGSHSESLILRAADRERSVREKTRGSLQRFERSARTLAGGVSSGLRRSARPYPLFFDRGKGSRVWDVDGNSYIDFGLAWGPLILGHAPDCIADAISAQVRKGLTFGAQHDLEFEVSELLNEIIPCADLVAFANSGTEIVLLALRLARAVTGRMKYLKFEGHYHGWGDQALVSYHPNVGEGEAGGQRQPVPVAKGQLPHDHVVVAAWNSREEVDRAFADHHGQISAIFCEPLLANSGCIPAEPGFLEFLRETATRHSALLIFDEVITGLRLELGGGQTRYGVIPDLATFAKAVGAGLPLSVLAGRRQYMQPIASGEVVHAGSLNGNPVVLSGARAALQELRSGADTIYPRMRKLGEMLASGLVKHLRASGLPAVSTGDGPVFTIHLQQEAPVTYRDTLAADRQTWSDFVLALLDESVLVLPDGRWYISAAHSEEDIDEALQAAERAARSVGK